ncbi:hypothetical protein FRC03_007907, partial [Tulasnella sp. 419]
MLLSNILVFLAIVSSARAGYEPVHPESAARARVRSLLKDAGLEECPDDQEMPIHEDASTTFRGFPVIGMGDRSYVYQAKLFAVGLVHCVYKIDSKLGKYDGWFVFTRRGQAMIDLNKMLAISDRLLEYGSLG